MAKKVIRGFLYKKGTDDRIPYWVTQKEADTLALKNGGRRSSFRMGLPGYGIMDPVEWEFRRASPEEIAGREHWGL